MSIYFCALDHPAQAETLRALVQTFVEWSPTERTEPSRWPELLSEPYTLGSDIGHRVIMIIKGDDAQIKHFTLKFYKHCRIHLDRCFEVMATTKEGINKIIDDYGYETST